MKTYNYEYFVVSMGEKWWDFLDDNHISSNDDLNAFLEKYNGTDKKSSDYILFETEEDALAFRLRFGV